MRKQGKVGTSAVSGRRKERLLGKKDQKEKRKKKKKEERWCSYAKDNYEEKETGTRG